MACARAILTNDKTKNTSHQSIVGTGMWQPPDRFIQVDILKTEDQCRIDEDDEFEDDIVV